MAKYNPVNNPGRFSVKAKAASMNLKSVEV